MTQKLSLFFKRFRQTLHLMVGMPDYEAYVTHLRTHHPDRPIPTRKAFADDCIKRRYDSKGQPNRCC